MQQISLTYYSDVLCVWAYIAQVRVDELAQNFPQQIKVELRFCSIFGDTANKIATGWQDRGGYSGFGKHVQASVKAYPHVSVHPDLWKTCRPASSTPAHLMLKAVQKVDQAGCATVLNAIRAAFFQDCRNIAQWPVLQDIVAQTGIAVKDVQSIVDSGTAHAALEADIREQHALMVQGSPSFILNEGRQKLYGNVGYGVIEANIKELLRSPDSGAASWC